VLYGLVLRAHLLVLLKKREFLAAPERCRKEYVAGRFQAEDFDKRGSGKQDAIADVVLSPEEMEMYVDLHPFTNTSPYTVVETMSLAKALVLFREVGLRHLLVVPKACDVSAGVPHILSFDFFDINFDYSSYLKIYTKYHFFCRGLFINQSFSRMTDKKSQTSYNLRWREYQT